MSLIYFPEYISKCALYGFAGKNSQGYDADYTKESKSPQALLGLPNYRLLKLRQVHSNICINIQKNTEALLEGDAQVTNEVGVVLAIQTADCVPIIFIDEKQKVIGAAHAGWKGALSGIISSTVEAMQKLGSDPKDIIAILGPAIQQESYEVNMEFYDEFLKESANNLRFFKNSSKQSHYLFDLPQYVKSKLKVCSIKNIKDIKLDTYKDEENFYSYRRCTHKNEDLSGRILSLVALK